MIICLSSDTTVNSGCVCILLLFIRSVLHDDTVTCVFKLCIPLFGLHLGQYGFNAQASTDLVLITKQLCFERPLILFRITPCVVG